MGVVLGTGLRLTRFIAGAQGTVDGLLDGLCDRHVADWDLQAGECSQSVALGGKNQMLSIGAWFLRWTQDAKTREG